MPLADVTLATGGAAATVDNLTSESISIWELRQVSGAASQLVDFTAATRARPVAVQYAGRTRNAIGFDAADYFAILLESHPETPVLASYDGETYPALSVDQSEPDSVTVVLQVTPDCCAQSDIALVSDGSAAVRFPTVEVGSGELIQDCPSGYTGSLARECTTHYKRWAKPTAACSSADDGDSTSCDGYAGSESICLMQPADETGEACAWTEDQEAHFEIATEATHPDGSAIDDVLTLLQETVDIADVTLAGSYESAPIGDVTIVGDSQSVSLADVTLPDGSAAAESDLNAASATSPVAVFYDGAARAATGVDTSSATVLAVLAIQATAANLADAADAARVAVYLGGEERAAIGLSADGAAVLLTVAGTAVNLAFATASSPKSVKYSGETRLATGIISQIGMVYLAKTPPIALVDYGVIGYAVALSGGDDSTSGSTHIKVRFSSCLPRDGGAGTGCHDLRFPDECMYRPSKRVDDAGGECEWQRAGSARPCSSKGHADCINSADHVDADCSARVLSAGACEAETVDPDGNFAECRFVAGATGCDAFGASEYYCENRVVDRADTNDAQCLFHPGTCTKDDDGSSCALDACDAYCGELEPENLSRGVASSCSDCRESRAEGHTWPRTRRGEWVGRAGSCLGYGGMKRLCRHDGNWGAPTPRDDCLEPCETTDGLTELSDRCYCGQHIDKREEGHCGTSGGKIHCVSAISGVDIDVANLSTFDPEPPCTRMSTEAACLAVGTWASFLTSMNNSPRVEGTCRFVYEGVDDTTPAGYCLQYARGDRFGTKTPFSACLGSAIAACADTDGSVAVVGDPCLCGATPPGEVPLTCFEGDYCDAVAKSCEPAPPSNLGGIYNSAYAAVQAGDTVYANYYKMGYFYEAEVVSTTADHVRGLLRYTVQFSDESDDAAEDVAARDIILRPRLAEDTKVWARESHEGPLEAGAVMYYSSGNYAVDINGATVMAPDNLEHIRPYREFDKLDRVWCEEARTMRWKMGTIIDKSGDESGEAICTDCSYLCKLDTGHSLATSGDEMMLIHHHKGFGSPQDVPWMTKHEVVELLAGPADESCCNVPDYQFCDESDITCENGGTIQVGYRHLGCSCECSDGYLGNRCEIAPTCLSYNYQCAHGYRRAAAKDDTACPLGECSEELCCSITCQSADFTGNGADTCTGAYMTRSEARVAQACPDGAWSGGPPTADDGSGCTDDLCCRGQTCQEQAHACVDPTMTRDFALDAVVCTGTDGECDDSMCCRYKTCQESQYTCSGAGYVPDIAKASDTCAGGVCDDPTCCREGSCSENSYDCDCTSGPTCFVNKDAYNTTPCAGGACDDTACCDTATCASEVNRSLCTGVYVYDSTKRFDSCTSGFCGQVDPTECCRVGSCYEQSRNGVFSCAADLIPGTNWYSNQCDPGDGSGKGACDGTTEFLAGRCCIEPSCIQVGYACSDTTSMVVDFGKRNDACTAGVCDDASCCRPRSCSERSFQVCTDNGRTNDVAKTNYQCGDISDPSCSADDCCEPATA